MTASLGAGIRAAWQDPTVRAVLLITVLMNVLLFPYQHMLVVFPRDVLRAGPEWLGALVAADGLGSLLGALVIASRRGFVAHRRLFVAAVLTAPLLLMMFTGARSRWVCVALLVVIGVAPAIAVNSLMAFLTIAPVAVPLARRAHGREGASG